MSSEPFQTLPQQSTGGDGPPIAVAILLIVAGIVLLLVNLGVISTYDARQLVRLWPLILAYIGLKQILSRPSAA
ncbi:MAG TPA: hypothetical protein GX714_01670 [Chloroflexi bacterium]|jgi:hypothetical protein|nr:hypothetical protein [Chloroflexota bacterium]